MDVHEMGVGQTVLPNLTNTLVLWTRLYEHACTRNNASTDFINRRSVPAGTSFLLMPAAR